MKNLVRNANPGFSADCEKMKTKNGDLVAIDITTYEGPNLKEETPSIGLLVDGKVVAELTWDESRDFAGMLEEVTNVAEYG